MKLRTACRTVSALVLVAGAVLAGWSHAWWTALVLASAASVIASVGFPAPFGADRTEDHEAVAKALRERLARARLARARHGTVALGDALPASHAQRSARAFLTPWFMAVRADDDARWTAFFRDELRDESWRRLAHEVTALRSRIAP